ncbi:MAG: efflux RND transporter periplasmic adaptor subunit [Bacteroidetes bacterium]|nr:efflux RND transporter periplasmic adaptor subunit [Bacteroidota bacterium]
MKNNKKIIWGILILALIIGGWFYLKRKETPKIELQTTQPVMGSISTTVTATGTIQPVDTIAVGTQISGIIKNLYVDFNSTVKKGQLLAVLDPDLYQDQVNQYKANLANAKSNVNFNEINFNLQSQLYKIGAISKADYDTALNSYNQAKVQVNAVLAQLASAQKNLSLTNIYSPIDGTILNRNVSQGQTVASSFSTPQLFSIAKDLSKMQVRTSVDEADIGNVKVGDSVTFSVEAYPTETFKGTVTEIRLHPTVSSNVVKYITMVNADNSDLKLKPGMTADINIQTSDTPNVMKIPIGAISYQPDSLVTKVYTVVGGQKGNHKRNNPEVSQNQNSNLAHVWILGANNSLTKKKIKTGVSNDTDIQVVSGLNVNEKIVVGSTVVSTANNTSQSSPFLPKFGNKNKKKPQNTNH